MDRTSCAFPAPFGAGKGSTNETRSSKETCSGSKLRRSVLHYLFPWFALRRLVQPRSRRICSTTVSSATGFGAEQFPGQLLACRSLRSAACRTQWGSSMQRKRAYQWSHQLCRQVERSLDVRSASTERAPQSTSQPRRARRITPASGQCPCCRCDNFVYFGVTVVSFASNPCPRSHVSSSTGH